MHHLQVAQQIGRPVRPARLPAGHRERLARRPDGDRSLPHIGQRANANVPIVIVDHPLVHLVGDAQHIVLFAQIGDLRQLFAVQQ